MIEKGYMPPLAEARSLGQAAMFQGGKIALSIDGDWMIPTYSDTENIEVGFYPAAGRARGQLEHVQRPRRRHLEGHAAQGGGVEVGAVPGDARVPEHRRQRRRGVPRHPEATVRAVAAHKENGVDVSAFTSYLEEKRTFLYPITDKAPQINLIVQPTMEKILIGSRGPERLEGHERPGEQPPGVLRVTGSERLAVAGHASAVAAAAAAAAAAGGPAIWTGMVAFVGPLLVLPSAAAATRSCARTPSRPCASTCPSRSTSG